MIHANVPRRFPQVDLSDVRGLRDAWAGICADDMDSMLRTAEDDVVAEEISIPVRDATVARALVFKPKQADDGRPLIILIHGGGFLFGTPEMEASGCISATKSYGCITISLSYRLSPESKFPVAYEDCWDALHWVRYISSV